MDAQPLKPKSMASQRKPTKNRDPNQITVAGIPGEDPGITFARAVLQPELLAAGTLKRYGKDYGDLDLEGLIAALKEQTRASSGGDLKRADAMLTTQAHTLDALFNNLAQGARDAEYLDNFGKLDTCCVFFVTHSVRTERESRFLAAEVGKMREMRGVIKRIYGITKR